MVVAESTASRARSFTNFAWAMLAWNLLVILWGVYVRASGSGAGCGSHWPLCNGEVIPHSPQAQTIIEFTHRLMSGVAFIGVVGLAIWSRVRFEAGHRVRRAAMFSLFFLVVEALLGAGLVLMRFVGENASAGRAFYLGLHLLNTQFLLAALLLTAWYSRESAVPSARPSWMVAAALPVALLVSITGAIAALGDTLFPSASLAQGLRQDFSASAHFLIRLRGAHPLLAIMAAAYFCAMAIVILRVRPAPLVKQIALAVLALTLVQFCAGAINLALLAPAAMQILHLLLADLLWISLVLLTVETPASALAKPVPAD